jgi:hypothetical protein
MSRVHELVRMMAGERETERQAALEEIKRMSFKAMPDLITILCEADVDIKMVAIKALYRVDPTWCNSMLAKRAVPHLLQWIKDSDPVLRKLGLEYLQEIDPEQYEEIRNKYDLGSKEGRKHLANILVIAGLLLIMGLTVLVLKSPYLFQVGKRYYHMVVKGDQAPAVKKYFAAVDKAGCGFLSADAVKFCNLFAKSLMTRDLEPWKQFAPSVLKRRGGMANLKAPLPCEELHKNSLIMFDEMKLMLEKTENLKPSDDPKEFTAVYGALNTVKAKAEECDRDERSLRKAYGVPFPEAR